MAASEKNAIWVVGALLLLVIAGVAGLIYLGVDNEKDIVGADGCLLNRESETAHVILVDTSDRISPPQESLLKLELELLIKEAQRGDIVAIYALTQDFQNPVERLIRACSPGSDPNLWVEGKPAWEHRRKEFFDAIAALEFPDRELQHSRIIEAFRALADREFRARRQGANRLIVASDMLQNSEALSHYEEPLPSFRSFQEAPEYPILRPNFAGAHVQILYIQRRGHLHLQSRDHIRWWEALIYDNDGELRGDPPVKRI